MKPIRTMNNADLWYSEDDDMETGKGYYWQHHKTNKASQSYTYASTAVSSMKAGKVRYRR